MEKNKIQGR